MRIVGTIRDPSFWNFILRHLANRPVSLIQYARLSLLRKRAVANVTLRPLEIVQKFYREIRLNERLKAHLESRLRSEPYAGQNFYTSHELYVICRLLQPRAVVETGVASGHSSAFLLQALHDQGQGHLYSIDAVNSYTVGENTKRQTGWLVPLWLRDRWTLTIGRTTRVLEPLMKKLGTIDLFYHDSDHSYGNMMFEFETAYGYLRKPGIIMADNIDWNQSFHDFCAKHYLRGKHISANLGAVRIDK